MNVPAKLIATSRTSIFQCLAIIGIATLLGGCSNEVGTGKPGSVAEVRVTYRQGTVADPVAIVLPTIALSDKQLKVRLVPASSPTDALNKLENGEADVAAGIPLEALLGAIKARGEKGVDFEAFQVNVETPGSAWLAIVAGPSVDAKTLKDLAGKPIGIPPVRQAEYFLQRILSNAGVPSDQIKIERFNPIAPTAGIQSGQFVGIYATEPFISVVLADGGHIVSGGPTPALYDGEPLPVIFSVITKKFKTEHPAEYREFLGLVETARNEIRTKPESVRDTFTKPENGGISPAVAKHLAFPEMRAPDAKLRKTAERMMEDMVRDGLHPAGLNLDPLFPRQ